MGEPKRWESSLQLLVDILKTGGRPDKAPEAMPENHLPVIACNMDLQFMDRACMPRYVNIKISSSLMFRSNYLYTHGLFSAVEDIIHLEPIVNHHHIISTARINHVAIALRGVN